MKRRPILAILAVPKRESHWDDTQYSFRIFGRWLMVASIFAAVYSYGWEQLRESLGFGGIILGLIIGATCGFGAGQLWRLAIETESEGGKIAYRTAWTVCMAVVLWGMFTLFNNGLNESYRDLQAAERRDGARLEQAAAMRGDQATITARLGAAQARVAAATARLRTAEERQGVVQRVVLNEQSEACTDNAEIRAIQTAMNIEPIDGCARNITGGRVAAELVAAQEEMAEANAAQERVFADQDENTARVASGAVAEVEFEANEADEVGGFARFFRGVSLISYKAQGWMSGERNTQQDDIAAVDDRAQTIGMISLFLLSFVIDLLSPVFNSVGSRPKGSSDDPEPAPEPLRLLPQGPAGAAAVPHDFVAVGPRAYAHSSSVVSPSYRSPPRPEPPAPPMTKSAPAKPKGDESILGCQDSIDRLSAMTKRLRRD